MQTRVLSSLVLWLRWSGRKWVCLGATVLIIMLTTQETVAIDLETFARHAGRSTVSTDDVLLLTRRNEALQSIMRDYIEKKEAEGKKGKANANK